jgi:predicted dehydrogenase
MIKTALIGFGWWGQHIARRLVDNPNFELVCVVEPVKALHNGIKRLGLKVLENYEDALSLPEVEALILTSPNDLHDEHVFCEKPLSLSAAGAKASIKACRTAGLILGIGHERRFEPAILALRKLLDDGAVGTVMHTEMAFSHDKLIGLTSDSWRTTSAFAPAAGMTQMGIHLTDLLISFYGPVTSLHAITADRSLGWETGDVVTVQLQFKAGMTATLQAILHTPHFIRTHVFGSDMWVEIRNATHPDTPGGKATMERYRSIDDVETKVFDWTDSVTANLEAFAAAIRGEAPYPYSDFELLHNIEVLDAIVQSAETGQSVQL